MASIHPQITHFPIALIITAFLFQGIVVFKRSWMCRSTPLWLLGLAIILSFTSTLSGEDAANLATSKMELLDSTITLIEQHETFGTYTVWASLAMFIGWIWLFFKYPADSRVDIVALAFLFLLSLSIGVTGYLGGELVMTYGVGVGL